MVERLQSTPGRAVQPRLESLASAPPRCFAELMRGDTMSVRLSFVVQIFALALAGWFTPLHATAASNHAYPDKPIRVIVGFSAGGAVDLAPRVIGEKLTETWNQPFITENRPGAGGGLAAQMVAKAAPDGYTLLSVSAAHVILPALSPTDLYDLKDFTGITTTISVPSVLVVNPSLGIKSVRGLVEMAKAKPGDLTFSSGGVGSGTHFAAELFKSLAAIDVRHVPYRGIPEAVTEVVANRIDFTFSPLSSALPLIRSGQVVALAVAPANRVTALPDVPTLDEAGVAGYRWDSWFGLLAPAQTPRAIVKALNREVVRIIDLPDVKKRWERMGAEAMPLTPEEFDKYLLDQSQLVARLVKAANIQSK
jgi:tripartite-type tricarboxylate transporter receptor subunit TctC